LRFSTVGSPLSSASSISRKLLRQIGDGVGLHM
jgi:hypothetical protein